MLASTKNMVSANQLQVQMLALNKKLIYDMVVQ